jgi:hypothetical protein
MKISYKLIDKIKQDCSFTFKDTEYHVRTYGGHNSPPTISFDSPKGTSVLVSLIYDLAGYFSVDIEHEPFLTSPAGSDFSDTEELPQPLRGLVEQALKGLTALVKDPLKFREIINQNLLDKL